MRVSVLGIGNTLLSDEGFGPAVAVEVRSRLADSALGRLADSADIGRSGDEDTPLIDVIDGGVLGMKLLPFFQTSDAVIVVDALDAGAEPGALFRFTPEQAELQATRPLSAHEIALPHLLETARLVGADPEVVVIGCQASDISTYSEDLTREVAAAVPRAVELVLDELARLGAIPPTP